jgi:hypothetical protein
VGKIVAGKPNDVEARICREISQGPTLSQVRGRAAGWITSAIRRTPASSLSS